MKNFCRDIKELGRFVFEEDCVEEDCVEEDCVEGDCLIDVNIEKDWLYSRYIYV